MTENTNRWARLEAERDEAVAMCRLAFEMGESQAKEWDRYWKALGMDSEEISVDDAIATYTALVAERDRLRDALEIAVGCAIHSGGTVCIGCADRVRATLEG